MLRRRWLFFERFESRVLMAAFNDDFNDPSELSSTSKWNLLNSYDYNNNNVGYAFPSSAVQIVNDPKANDGKALAITLTPVDTGNPNSISFSSSSIIAAPNTDGSNILYGHIEARIRLPGSGDGQADDIWPAFWLIGSNTNQPGFKWPICGEIDAMEYFGNTPNKVQGNVHGPQYHPDGTPIVDAQGNLVPYDLPDQSPFAAGQNYFTDYHTYAIDWAPDSIKFSVDGQVYKTLTPANLPTGSVWEFDHPFSVVLNVAEVPQGNSSITGSPTKSAEAMFVDYVHVTPMPVVTVPAATTVLNPVPSQAVPLSVQADGTSLTYTWTNIGGPGAVTFAANGTGASDNTTATFSTAGTYSLEVKMVDPYGQIAKSDVTVVVGSSPWQNTNQPCDVDGDSIVAPLDALIIINRLNDPTANNNTPLREPRPSGTQNDYIDVDGDGYVAPKDAVIVINYLNSHESSNTASASAEVAVVSSPSLGFGQTPLASIGDTPTLAGSNNGESQSSVSLASTVVRLGSAPNLENPLQVASGVTKLSTARSPNLPNNIPWDNLLDTSAKLEDVLDEIAAEIAAKK